MRSWLCHFFAFLVGGVLSVNIVWAAGTCTIDIQSGDLVITGDSSSNEIMVVDCVNFGGFDVVAIDGDVCEDPVFGPIFFDNVNSLRVDLLGGSGVDLVNADCLTQLNDSDTLVIGGGGDNTIIGGDLGETFMGGGGNDTIRGGGGRDNLLGDSGDDIIFGDGGDDTIDGGDGDDMIEGGDGNDIIIGREGNDVIRGGNNDDTIQGGLGADDISGGSGNDILFGNDDQNMPDNTLNGIGDILFGGDGNDGLSGGTANDILGGGPGNDDLNALLREFENPGNVSFDGAGGDDSFSISFALPRAPGIRATTTITITDDAGNDTFDFSQWPEGINIDLDTSGFDQAVSNNGLTVNINGVIETLIGTEFDDVFHVDPTATARTINGGGQQNGDLLNFDAKEKPFSDSGSVITSTGFAPVNYSNVENINILQNFGSIDIKANGSNRSLDISTGEPVSIAVSLSPGQFADTDADWYVAMDAPGGFQYFDLSLGFVPNFTVTYQGALLTLPQFEVFNFSGLAVGTHTFYFAIDTTLNGLLDDTIHFDAVVVNVN